MSRFVFFLGIFLMLVGFVGVVFGLITVPQQIISTVSQATNPDVKSLCKSGEQLATEEGPEEYDTIQHLYNRSTSFYCINDAGTKRDVTQQFADGFIQRMIGSFGSVIVPVLSCVLCAFGFIFALFGGIFFIRRRALSSVLVGQAAASAPPIRTSQSLNSSVLNAKLAQIEEARKSGLITEEEYQRMRQDALDSLR